MWYNAIVTTVLNSPLHGMMSGSVLVLTYKGRKSGKEYATPLEYLKLQDELLVISQRTHTWWRNFVGGAQGVPVSVRLQGNLRAANARAILDEAELVPLIAAFYHKRAAYAKYLSLTLDSQGEPTADSLKQAAKKYVIVKIKLQAA